MNRQAVIMIAVASQSKRLLKRRGPVETALKEEMPRWSSYLDRIVEDILCAKSVRNCLGMSADLCISEVALSSSRRRGQGAAFSQ